MSKRLALRLISALVVVVGVVVIALALPRHHAAEQALGPIRPSVASPTPTPTIIGYDPGTAVPSAAPRSSAPARVVIPEIGVDSALEGLKIEPDGELQSPTQFPVAGWFDGGVRPGDVGPAVIAGHVDSIHGPAVFYKLKDMKKGDTAKVVRADGSTVTFVVDDVEWYPKTMFPTELVYGPTSTAELRLITCTGDFDFSAHSYLDNLVVYLHLVS